MKSRFLPIGLLSFAFISASVFGNTSVSLPDALNEYALLCSLTGAAGMANVRLASTPTQKDAALNAAYDDAKKCIAEKKVEGKDAFKAAVEATPALGNELAVLYAKWLSYMDTLATPAEFSVTPTDEEKGFQDAANLVRAKAIVLGD